MTTYGTARTPDPYDDDPYERRPRGRTVASARDADPPTRRAGGGGFLAVIGAASAVLGLLSTILTLASQLGAFGDFRIPFLPGVAVQPTISVSASRGPSGSQVTVSGERYAGGEQIVVAFHATEIARGRADGDGRFRLTGTVPADFDVFGEHRYDIRATGGGSHRTATAPFLLTIGPAANPTISLAKGAGPSGTKIRISGSGFGHGDTIEIRFNVDVIGRARADGGGNFTAQVTIPGTYDAFGSQQHTITATGMPSVRTASAQFRLTA